MPTHPQEQELLRSLSSKDKQKYIHNRVLHNDTMDFSDFLCLLEACDDDEARNVILSLTSDVLQKTRPNHRVIQELYRLNIFSHALGMDNFIRGLKNEGQSSERALATLQENFKFITEQMSSKGAPSPHPVLHLYAKETPFNIQGIINDENFFSKQAEWCSKEGVHSFTFALIKEEEHFHFIYINRGQRTNEEQVTVYTFDKVDDMQRKITELENLCKVTERMEDVEQFLASQDMQQYKNNHLMQIMQKSDQKVGTCAIANRKMAWHLQLAADYMKSQHCSLEEAYIATKPHYKAMRRIERANVFCDLLQNPISDPTLHTKTLVSIMGKLAKKAEKDIMMFSTIFNILSMRDSNRREVKKLFEFVLNLPPSDFMICHGEEWLDICHARLGAMSVEKMRAVQDRIDTKILSVQQSTELISEENVEEEDHARPNTNTNRYRTLFTDRHQPNNNDEKSTLSPHHSLKKG